jgi:hypothetical protein
VNPREINSEGILSQMAGLSKSIRANPPPPPIHRKDSDMGCHDSEIVLKQTKLKPLTSTYVTYHLFFVHFYILIHLLSPHIVYR